MGCRFFPDGSWVSCCDAHDLNYSVNSKVTRKSADQKLQMCVAKSGYPLISWLMYAGVRLFGWMFYKGKH